MRALLAPRAVAIMGASADPTKAGGRPIAYMRALGYSGRIYPVNPARAEIGGLTCFPDLKAIGAPVDLCIITLPAERVEAALAECAAAKVPAAVVFSSGFAEVGPEGRAIQERMRTLAETHGIALCGPNCLGLVSVAAKVAATFTTALERRPDLPFGHVGFISQSGAIAAFILALMQDRGFGLSHFITTGNEAALGFTDYALHLLDQPEVKVIAGYVEGLARDDLLALAAKARARRKPLVLMKVGASAAGARASLAHTGNLVGNDAAYGAAFHQFGILRPQTVDELLDFSHVLATQPLPRGARVGLVTISGGAGILMADWSEALGLDVAPLAADTVARLKPVLPWFATPANPLDTTGRPLWDAGMLESAITAVANDPGIDMVLVYVGLAPGPALRIGDEILAGARAAGVKPVLVCWLPENEQAAHAKLHDAGLPIFTEPVRMVKAAAALARHARAAAAPLPRALRASDVLPRIAAPLPPGEVVGEHAAKRFLKAAGIEITRETLVRSADEAATAAKALGYPVCLKVVSPDIPHRTEIGAVTLDLRSEDQVRAAHDAVRAAALAAVPNARIEGVLVQEMIQGGCELIVSAYRDPKLGPAVICGLGGILVEVLKDTVMRLAPVSQDEAQAMLGELKGAAILSGVRGAPPVDTAAAVRALCRLSEIIAADAGGIDTIEINPLAVLPRGQGVRALDALITPVADAEAAR